MENNPQFDRELLSGYLDDALNSSERRQAEALLASHPAAARYLEALRSTRQALRDTTTSRLNSSFADRVIELARQRAIADQLPAEHHVMVGVATIQIREDVGSGELAETGNTEVSHVSRQRDALLGSRWTWAAAAALAASVLWLVVGTIRQTPNAEQLAQDQLVPFEKVEGATDSSPQLADRQSTPTPNELVTDGLTTPEPTLPDMRLEPAKAVRNNSSESIKPEPDGSLLVLDVLFVMDVVMTPEAWDEGRFDKLLARNGLPITKAMRADKELLTAIVESRMVLGPDDAAEKSDKPKSEIALIFVQCKITDLERLAVEIESDKESYSDFTYDVGLDDKRMVLAKLLKKTAGKPSGKGEAKMIVPDSDVANASALFPAFVAPVKERQPQRVGAEQLDSRAAFKGMAMLDSEVLIVLRKQAP